MRSGNTKVRSTKRSKGPAGSLVAIQFDAPVEVSEPTGGSVEGALAAALARSMDNHNKRSQIRAVKESFEE